MGITITKHASTGKTMLPLVKEMIEQMSPEPIKFEAVDDDKVFVTMPKPRCYRGPNTPDFLIYEPNTDNPIIVSLHPIGMAAHELLIAAMKRGEHRVF